jgi:glycosyltransferase involved in cell wall biosynthesis
MVKNFLQVSVVVPVYNEENTIEKVLQTVLDQPVVSEVVVVDDCSRDGTLARVENFALKNNRFGVEPEITAKIVRLGVRIYEVSVSYYGRTYAEGKKIGWRDGVSAFRCILKYWWQGVMARPSS